MAKSVVDLAKASHKRFRLRAASAKSVGSLKCFSSLNILHPTAVSSSLGSEILLHGLGMCFEALRADRDGISQILLCQLCSDTWCSQRSHERRAPRAFFMRSDRMPGLKPENCRHEAKGVALSYILPSFPSSPANPGVARQVLQSTAKKRPFGGKAMKVHRFWVLLSPSFRVVQKRPATVVSRPP